MKNIRQQRADERDKTAQIFTWCMVVAMHQEEGIGATRLERACNEMHEFQQRYKTKILTENRNRCYAGGLEGHLRFRDPASAD